ncbi:MAG: DeoR/GlpR family DNA-binding transcription regulator [Candidatus Limnocylindrales bacterium]
MALAADRRVKILERVAEGMSIAVADLARDFGCSEMTIRRDIQRLERDGFLRRTYGGATAHLTRSLDLAFNARALAHAREKRMIALAATHRLGTARVLFLGIGTTVEQFARYLPTGLELTVATGSLPIASLLGTRSLRVVILGGTVRRDELSCVGPAARATLERYRFDLAVLGAAGLTARWGITDLNDEEAEVHRVATERSERLMVIADGSKLGVIAPAVVAPADRIETLVTDANAPQPELDALGARGVQIVIANREATLGLSTDAPDHDTGRGDSLRPEPAGPRGAGLIEESAR